MQFHFANLLPSEGEMWDWLAKDIQWRERLGIPAKHRHKLLGQKTEQTSKGCLILISNRRTADALGILHEPTGHPG